MVCGRNRKPSCASTLSSVQPRTRFGYVGANNWMTCLRTYTSVNAKRRRTGHWFEIIQSYYW